MVARWLLLYHGALHTVREHWPGLKAWADGAKGKGGEGLPDFYVWGDWCAVEARSVCTPGTGPQAAAANYVLALKAMVHMATALEEAEDATRYAAALAAAQAAFDQRYWDGSAGGWVGRRVARLLQPGRGGRAPTVVAFLALVDLTSLRCLDYEHGRLTQSNFVYGISRGTDNKGGGQVCEQGV